MSTATMMPQTSVPTTEIVGPIAPAPTKRSMALVQQEDLSLYRLTVDQYNAMVKAGIVDEKSRVVLLNGLLVSKMGKNPPHSISYSKTNAVLVKIVPDDWHISPDNPVELIDYPSVPEPDFMVLRGIADDYVGRSANTADVGLLVEISDSLLRIDQTLMKAAYAAAGIVVYWIINLVADRVEVYTDPTGPDTFPDYRRRTDFQRGDSIPLILDGQESARIAVSDLLPPPIESKPEA